MLNKRKVNRKKAEEITATNGVSANSSASSPFIFRYVTLFAITFFAIALVSISGFYGVKRFNQFINKPIATVVVNGDLAYLTKDAVISLIADNIHQSFVKENLYSMQEVLEAHLWVEQVSLRRHWPDTLVVNITEEKPIARWGKEGFVNYRGDVRYMDHLSLLAHLPRLTGADDKSINVIKQYQRLSQIVSRNGLLIDSLEQDTLGSWSLTLNNGWHIVAGRTAVGRKLQQFMQLLRQNKLMRSTDIASVDMRYEKGMAIRWHENNPVLADVKKSWNSEQNR